MSAKPRRPERDKLESGEKRKGLSFILAEIDPATLPELDDPWPEVKQRIEAYNQGRSGWRTGEIEQPVTEFDGGHHDE